jgi:hypothetical protein
VSNFLRDEANINAVWASAIIEECTRLGLTPLDQGLPILLSLLPTIPLQRVLHALMNDLLRFTLLVMLKDPSNQQSL